MKKDIHPKYYSKAQIKCACGAVFKIGSTKQEMETEICSACHPFYTGKEKIIETGQVEKFKKRIAKRSSALGLKMKKQKNG
ncbi:MAG: 50S ribosomal protein L31 [Firmicutes bacterium ML8_F2]|jgi:large subunit ribosomal protein L31|nr:MAG: 50S ribosomal protein L31 [Firmicutes bacterium ML8_F2]